MVVGRSMSDKNDQLRLQLEKQCAELGRVLKEKMPPGVGFTLFMFDFGEKGNMAYISTADREDSIKLTKEWIEHVEQAR
jgi:hypothetical protein